MCTAATYLTKDFYFGRTLDYEFSYGDEITTIGGIMGRVVAIKDDEDAIIIETGSDRVKMKFKKWCISTVDTVKEQPQQAGQPEKKGFFGFGKKKDSDETKATKE